MKFRSFAFAAIAVLLTVTHAPAQQGLPKALEGVGIDQRLDQQIPLDLKFRNESGAEVQLSQYFGDKPIVLSLVYYQCPMLCTEVLNGLLKTMKVMEFSMNKEFEVVTVSFDPKETPQLAAQKKEQYVDAYRRAGAENGWHFLTGNEESIRKLADAAGFRYKYDPLQNQFAHGAAIMILTPQGRISRYLYGVEYSARDLRLALVEASKNKIGTLVDQALLFCFHYDPSTGKYSAYVLNLVRLGGIITVLAFGAFFFAMRRRDKRAEVHG
jgi:protein SCO1/2